MCNNVLCEVSCYAASHRKCFKDFFFFILGDERWKNFCKGNFFFVYLYIANCALNIFSTRNPVEQSYYKMCVITVGLQNAGQELGYVTPFAEIVVSGFGY